MPAVDDARTRTQQDSNERPRRSPALFATGLVLAVAGVLLKNAVGGYLLLSEIGRSSERDESKVTAGYLCVGGGASLIAAGVPMAVIGGKRTGVQAAFLPVIAAGHASAQAVFTF